MNEIPESKHCDECDPSFSGCWLGEEPCRKKPTPASNPIEVIVKVVHRGDNEPIEASKLVWWLASLAAVQNPYRKPKIGDIVVETTHRMGLCKLRVGLLCAIGELIKIEKDGVYGIAYTIKTITGKEQRWLNASFSVVEARRE